jgi:hypothetical protein
MTFITYFAVSGLRNSDFLIPTEESNISDHFFPRIWRKSFVFIFGCIFSVLYEKVMTCSNEKWTPLLRDVTDLKTLLRVKTDVSLMTEIRRCTNNNLLRGFLSTYIHTIDQSINQSIFFKDFTFIWSTTTTTTKK